MALIRTIKPDFWVDEKIVECSIEARLLFIGLWNFADNEGRMEYRPAKIKMQIFPADSLQIPPLVEELQREKLVIVYVVDDKEYLQIRNFAKHQKVDKRYPSKYPGPHESPPIPAESPRSNGKEGKGKEGKGRESKPRAKARRSPKTPIPEDFGISDRVQQWADEKGHTNLPAHLECFTGKAQAHDYRYADWDAAFMEAIRKDWAGLAAKSKPPADSEYERMTRGMV